MRGFVALLMAVTLGFASRADADPPLRTNDPAVYARAFADAMTLTGVQPIREAFGAMLGAGGSLSGDLDAALRTYESDELTLPASIARIADDVALSDVFRVIYLYHYFGGNYWLFTRLEFVRINDGRWALARLAFADRWSGVALASSPGFRPGAPAR